MTQTGAPRLFVVLGGLENPAILTGEARAADALRDECPSIDPTTGYVLSTVDGYDVADYADMLQYEELERGSLAPYFIAELPA